MALECINPTSLPTPTSYSHGVIARGSRLVFVAGQVAEDSEGNVVGRGDMSAQARQVFANIGRILAACGAKPEQVTKLTIYVAGYKRDYLALIEAGRVEVFGSHKPTDTLIGVAMLTRPEYLLEVDALAVVD